ncbi:MAG TPA: hypothetical protein VFV78_04585 [Vicinamibacterales bacterium]|nr:hypothetical protein [Vicinamibacterales bacterium]
MKRTPAKLAFLVLVVACARVTAQTFIPGAQPPQVTFVPPAAQQPRITLETSGSPATLHYVSTSGDSTIDASGRDAKAIYTKSGLIVDLTDGTISSWKSPWRNGPSAFKTLHLEFSTLGELVTMKMQ